MRANVAERAKSNQQTKDFFFALPRRIKMPS